MKKKTITELSCTRCGNSWFPRKPEPPKNCPNCNSPYWDKPRKEKKKQTGA